MRLAPRRQESGHNSGAGSGEGVDGKQFFEAPTALHGRYGKTARPWMNDALAGMLEGVEMGNLPLGAHQDVRISDYTLKAESRNP